MDPLFERLKSLGLVQASQMEPKKETVNQKPLEEVLEGEVVSNSLGSCCLVSSQYPWKYHHGKVVFERKSDFSLVAEAAKAGSIGNSELSSLLFLDTETTGLAGGTGTLAFNVGLGYFSDDGFVLKQYIIRDPTEEAAMLLELANLMERFEGLVTFNGKSFDMPLLKARYVLNRLPVPFESMAHLDLLHLARKLWKNRLQSRALQDLEQQILEIPRTADEVPGWMIPEIYFNYLRTGNAEPLKGVVYHNGMDIVSLAALFLYISDSFEQDSEIGRLHPVDYFSIGQLFFDLQMFDLSQKIFMVCIEKHALPNEMHISSLKYVGSVYKRQNRFDLAVEVWESAVALDDLDSSLELAKYFEHTARDNETALIWADSAWKILEKRGYHSYKDRQLKKELQKRKDRLLRNIEKENSHVSKKDS